jgi:hypothetical protein
MFFINFYATIARFLIRTRVKYPETLKGNNFLDQIFLNLEQYSEWMKGLLYQF